MSVDSAMPEVGQLTLRKQFVIADIPTLRIWANSGPSLLMRRGKVPGAAPVIGSIFGTKLSRLYALHDGEPSGTHLQAPATNRLYCCTGSRMAARTRYSKTDRTMALWPPSA